MSGLRGLQDNPKKAPSVKAILGFSLPIDFFMLNKIMPFIDWKTILFL